MGLSLSERASEGIRALSQKKKFTQRALAKKIKRPPSVVNRIVHGRQPVTLRVLEAVGDLAGVNPLEMLIDPKDEMKLVNPIEAELLRYFRSWPHSTKLALVTFASFFADEDPAIEDQRRAHQQLRDLGDAQRRLAYAYLLFLTEGDLAPDIRRGLGLPEIDAKPQKPQKPQTKRLAPKKP